MSDFPPDDALDWIAARSGWASADARRLPALRHQLRHAAAFRAADVCGRELPEQVVQLHFVPRLWDCLEFHWRRAASGTEELEQLLKRVSAGELGGRQVDGDVLVDVSLAQAMELHEATAAERFEQQYMPNVRRTARGMGGPAAVDVVDNLAADLILPRGDRPPRIRTYRGKTTLASWLRAVVANSWISHLRSQRPTADIQHLSLAQEAGIEAAADQSDCVAVLRPIFHQVVRSADVEDRLLLKLLVLDGVPQHQVARALRVHSGTITRRHQRAAAKLLSGVRHMIVTSDDPRKGSDCLELVLANEDSTLKTQLAELVADGVRAPGAFEVKP